MYQATMHGNEPSKGARIDKELKEDDEATMKGKDRPLLVEASVVRTHTDYFARQGSRGQGPSWKHKLRMTFETKACYAWRRLG